MVKIENKKKLAIYFISFVFAFEGLLNIIFVVLRLLRNNLNLVEPLSFSPALELTTTTVECLLSILGLIGGIGVLKLKAWACRLLILVSIGNLCLFIFIPLVTPIFVTGSTFSAALLSLLSVFLQNRFSILFYIFSILYLISSPSRQN
jgi:hypothetical protein